MSLNGNAVIPVLFFNTLISSLIFVPFILLSFYTDCLDGTMVYVPRASLEDHVKVLIKAILTALVRHLDNQDRVLSQQTDQHHQRHLRVNVILQPYHVQQEERAEHTRRKRQDNRKRKQ